MSVEPVPAAARTGPDQAAPELDPRPARLRPVRLRRLSDAVGAVVHGLGDESLTVRGLTLSSRGVRAGDLYAALPGTRTHGARFAAEAAAAGAVALLSDPAGVAQCAATGLPVLELADPRARLGDLARMVNDDAAARVATTGVTGTQGKTTVTYLLEAGLAAAGARPAVIGTTGTRIDGRRVSSALTTPEAPDLHALFAVMREQGAGACAMEVSSHALVQGRVDGIVFDVAVFLNLGRDHLDFHTTMEDYFAAKASLFTPERARRAVLNADDEHGRRLVASVDIPVATWSTEGRDADWQAGEVRPDRGGFRFTLRDPHGRSHEASVPLPGRFNVSNATAAIVALVGGGWPLDAVLEGIARAPGVPGRMEQVEAGQPFQVVVDYAHKPEALDAVLRALRSGTSGRLVVVLGAGGDRDAGKRPVMGAVAARLADVVVVTDDNPRSEDPAAVRAAVIEGARSAAGSAVVQIGDRRDAIDHALQLARAGDCVLIAGKGHETGQEIGSVVHPFDDREVVRELLKNEGAP